MKGCMSTDLGIITVDQEVIAKYAGTVAVVMFWPSSGWLLLI